MVDEFSFWIDVVVMNCIAISGLILNLFAIYILSTRRSMRNFFNSLLISLFVFDSTFLLMVITETLLRRYKNYAYVIIFPHFLYTLRSISLTASIFVTIGVAYERFVAITRPIIHRQLRTSSTFRRRNLLKYILSVIISSTMFSIPQFFELEVEWSLNSTDTTVNETFKT